MFGLSDRSRISGLKSALRCLSSWSTIPRSWSKNRGSDWANSSDCAPNGAGRALGVAVPADTADLGSHS